MWWKNRAERDKIDEISSGDATVDKHREIYRKIIIFWGPSGKEAPPRVSDELWFSAHYGGR